MLYNKILLEHQLQKKKNFEILEKYGYHESSTLEERLHLLSRRIESSEQFPHEIGVFLGYPADDILGLLKIKVKIICSVVTGKYIIIQNMQEKFF